MTIPVLIFACFATALFLAFTFLLTIYIMEYRREQKALDDYKGFLKQDKEQLSSMLSGKQMYLVDLPVAPKKKAAPPPPAPPKDKKNIN